MINSTHSESQKESLLHDNRMRMSGIIVDDLDPRCEPIADNINGSQIICLGDITFEMTYDSATFSFLTEYSTEADIASLPRIYLLKGKICTKMQNLYLGEPKLSFMTACWIALVVFLSVLLPRCSSALRRNIQRLLLRIQ